MGFGERDRNLVPLFDHCEEGQARSDSGGDLVEGELELTPAAVRALVLRADNPRGKGCFLTVPVSE